LACKVTVENTQTKPGGEVVRDTCTGQCLYTPDRYRLRSTDRGLTTDAIWHDAVRTTVAERLDGGVRGVAAGRDAVGTPFTHRADPFARGLLVLNRPGTAAYLPFEELAAQAESAAASTTTVAGRAVVRAELRLAGPAGKPTRHEVVVLFDPAANHLIRAVTYTNRLAAGVVVRDDTVEEFREAAPGLFFPSRVSLAIRSGGVQTLTVAVRFDGVTVSRPLPPDAFGQQFPTGVVMTDAVRGTSYPVDARGRSAGREVPLARAVPPPSLADAESPRQSESAGEATSPWRWLRPASLVLLVGGVALAARRCGWRPDDRRGGRT
jgi:hypothetical protein